MFDSEPSEKDLGTVVPHVGDGCSHCRGTGDQGRIGFEMMSVEDKIQSLIQRRVDASQIRDASRSIGMKLLKEDGVQKIIAGKTTVEEVARFSMHTNDE